MGAVKYCEYPANFIRIMQRFVFGIDLRLDGSLAISPTVPEEYWDKGFGQVLVWRRQRMQYKMRGNRIAGQFRGLLPQRLFVKLPKYSPGTGVNATIDGRSVDCDRGRRFLSVSTCLLPGRITDMKFAVF